MKKQNEVNLFRSKSIIKFVGKDFLGEIGIDSRIFKALTNANISVGLIAQQSIENEISVLVNTQDAKNAVDCLLDEFDKEKKSGKVSHIYSIDEVAVIGFVTKEFKKILFELERNNVFPLLLNHIAEQGRVNIVVADNQASKTKNIIEHEIFGQPKNVHLAIIGHGNVGKTLINQILERAEEIRKRKKVNLKVIAVANSRKMAINPKGFSENWEKEIAVSNQISNMQDLINFSKEHQLENLIAIDNTASKDFVKNYTVLAENGFDLVSSNKNFNTLSINEYRNLRKILNEKSKKYLYETNVGAGLPLIDTIKLLHLSGENITRIKGVFSGSLSYIFNNFSVRDEKFSIIIGEAMEKGFTEPDPREDLSGNDVARKLLILARELDLINEFEDINIQNLIPEQLLNIDKESFISKLNELDEDYLKIKIAQKDQHVLRYVGDLHGDLQSEKGILEVKLVSVPASSALGQLKGSDSIFEIYTESYGENPIVIMGAGAGAVVTARGVFGDILRISENK